MAIRNRRQEHGSSPENAALLRDGGADFSRKVGHLIENLGLMLPTLAAGLEDGRTIKSWADGKGAPTEEQKEKLDTLHEVVEKITKEQSPAIARAFLIGMNPDLGDRSVISVIGRSKDLAKARAEVISAVNTFLHPDSNHTYPASECPLFVIAAPAMTGYVLDILTFYI